MGALEKTGAKQAVKQPQDKQPTKQTAHKTNTLRRLVGMGRPGERGRGREKERERERGRGRERNGEREGGGAAIISELFQLLVSP